MTEEKIPRFLVIGAMRAGTTSLQEMLGALDGVCLARMKETDYFIAERNYKRGKAWYRNQFDKPGAICGEISPNYTKRDVFKGVPERVYEANPDVKLIYIARDPVERAVSQYNFSYLYGKKMPAFDELMESHEGRHIINTSRYAWQLEPWVNVFGREAILIIDFKDLCNSPEKVLQEIGRFIGLGTDVTLSKNTAENSSENLGSMPLWYFRLRDTRFGTTMRTLMPRGFGKKIKQMVSGKGKERRPPPFPEGLKDRIRQVLGEDIIKFQEINKNEHN